jgi:hypothetical protein
METELNTTHLGVRKLFKEARKTSRKDEVGGKASGN